MITFRWLHLTDIHFTCTSDVRLQNVREALFTDLAEFAKHNPGDLDVVIFSGDQVSTGQRSEFIAYTEFLCDLWQQFRQHHWTPFLVAVPGNHDLVQQTDPTVRQLVQQWNHEKGDAILADAASPFCLAERSAFSEYRCWWELCAHRPPRTHSGKVSGDFAVALKKDGAIVGIIGLNSAFLTMAQGVDMRTAKRLDLPFVQFAASCPDHDPPKWLRDVNACLLVTHHPSELMHEVAQERFRDDIYPLGRFAVHLCGDLHSRAQRMEGNGTRVRRTWRGASLFGIEGKARLHGYAIGELRIRPGRATGEIRQWPRIEKTPGSRRLEADRDNGAQSDGWTIPDDFALLRTVLEDSANRSVPTQSIWYGPHFFPLQDGFRGRLEQRRALTRWLLEDTSPMRVLHAIGGGGKSSLAWVWARNDIMGFADGAVARDGTSARVGDSFRGVFWWNFDRSMNTRFESFVQYCLRVARGTTLLATSADVAVTAEDIMELVAHFRARQCLIVWDQAENILRGADALAGTLKLFVKSLQNQNMSKLLMLSRTDGLSEPGDLLSGVPSVPLQGLSQQEARELAKFVNAGLSEFDCQEMYKRVHGHPLSIRHLARFPNSTAFDVADPSGKELRDRIVAESVTRLAAISQLFLASLSAFQRDDVPASVVALVGEVLGIQEKERTSAINELASHSFLTQERDSGVSLHPVARTLAYQSLSPEQRNSIHSALATWYKRRLSRDLVDRCAVDLPAPLEPMRVLIQRDRGAYVSVLDFDNLLDYCMHAARAQDYQTALRILVNAVALPLYFQTGEYRRLIRILREFFENGAVVAPLARDRYQEAWLLTAMGNCKARIGEVDEALQSLDRVVELFRGPADSNLRAIGLGNRAFDLTLMGRLRLACADQTERTKVFDRRKYAFDCATAYLGLCYIEMLRGRFEDARRALEEAGELFEVQAGAQGELYCGMALVLLALAEGRADQALAERANGEAIRARRLGVNADIIRALWLCALVAMARVRKGDGIRGELLEMAQGSLEEAKNRSDRINLVHMDVELDLAWTKLSLLRQDMVAANGYAERAEEGHAV